MRAEGELRWLDILRDDQWARCHLAEKRGCEGVDARIAKLKQKISGCFRGDDGGSRFTRISSCTSSAKKQGINIYYSVYRAVENYSNLPMLWFNGYYQSFQCIQR